MRDTLMLKIAYLMPRWLVYFCTIRVWAYATTGSHSHLDSTAVTMDDALRVWDYKQTINKEVK